MIQYQALIEKFQITSLKELNELFWEEISFDWIKEYKISNEKFGIITLQNFFGFAFIIDDGNQVVEVSAPKEILESRVVGVFGISNTNIKGSNRKMMRKWIGKTSEIFSFYGDNYDKGHFIAHGFGGPIDVNLFPQRRDINRGWSNEGKIYRSMEKYVAANPGTFVFSRPIYNDLSFCPAQIEFGYCTADLKFHIQQFPNK